MGNKEIVSEKQKKEQGDKGLLLPTIDLTHFNCIIWYCDKSIFN